MAVKKAKPNLPIVLPFEQKAPPPPATGKLVEVPKLDPENLEERIAPEIRQ